MDETDGGTQESLARELETLADRIYKSHLPAYLQVPWNSGRGRWYEDWLRQQLDTLVITQTLHDPERLSVLKSMEPSVAAVFGVFGAAFRVLDHMGMHLRGQTFGQYELLPDANEIQFLNIVFYIMA